VGVPAIRAPAAHPVDKILTHRGFSQVWLAAQLSLAVGVMARRTPPTFRVQVIPTQLRAEQLRIRLAFLLLLCREFGLFRRARSGKSDLTVHGLWKFTASLPLMTEIGRIRPHTLYSIFLYPIGRIERKRLVLTMIRSRSTPSYGVLYN
jgi:hypothetical protein